MAGKEFVISTVASSKQECQGNGQLTILVIAPEYA